MGECGIYLGGKPIGWLRWWESEGRLALHAACPMEEGWIYRLILCTDRGAQRLGVMVPENGRFELKKTCAPTFRPLRGEIDRMRPGEKHLPGLPLASSAFRPAGEETLRLLGLEGEGLSCADFGRERYYLMPFRFGAPVLLPQLLGLMTVLEEGERSFAAFVSEQDRPKVFFPLREAETDRLRSESDV